MTAKVQKDNRGKRHRLDDIDAPPPAQNPPSLKDKIRGKKGDPHPKSRRQTDPTVYIPPLSHYGGVDIGADLPADDDREAQAAFALAQSRAQAAVDARKRAQDKGVYKKPLPESRGAGFVTTRQKSQHVFQGADGKRRVENYSAVGATAAEDKIHRVAARAAVAGGKLGKRKLEHAHRHAKKKHQEWKQNKKEESHLNSARRVVDKRGQNKRQKSGGGQGEGGTSRSPPPARDEARAGRGPPPARDDGGTNGAAADVGSESQI